MRYRHVWPGLALLASLGLLLVALLVWGEHFLSPGPSGGIHRMLQLWAASRLAEESAPLSAPPVAATPRRASEPPRAPAAGSPEAGRASPPAEADEALRSPALVQEPPKPEPVPAPPPLSAAMPGHPRYALALGTFSVPEDAERVEAWLNEAGFSTVRFRQPTAMRLFGVFIQSLGSVNEGQAMVERLRREGFPQAVVLASSVGVSVRVGQPVPLRTAVQVAERLRTAGHDSRVLMETTRAGQITLRHGNFASRGEAEAVSRDIARLGVPNEVVRVQ